MPSAFLHAFAPPAKERADFINIVRGEGATVWDDRGRSYVDGLASLWYCQVGHGRAEIGAAVAEQMSRIAGYNAFDPFTNDAAEEVAAMIVERSAHPGGRAFLACSGSEAVDTAMKLARLYHQRRGDTDRQIVITRTNAYHGTNLGGTSLQGIAPNREGWGDLVPHVVEVPNNDIEALSRTFAEVGNRVAAVITEPIQGAGGVWPPVEGYLPTLRRLCDDHGALLIFDEVICGFGRTGRWFGAQHFGIEPDLSTFAKGVTSGYLPLAGVVVGRRLLEVIEQPGFLLRHGYTYSGHPSVCAAGVANLRIMTDEALVERASWVGERLAAGLAALAADGTIAGYRGEGAVWAAELGRDAIPVRNELLGEGVILRPIGTALAICPPLVITDAELDRLLDALAGL